MIRSEAELSELIEVEQREKDREKAILTKLQVPPKKPTGRPKKKKENPEKVSFLFFFFRNRSLTLFFFSLSFLLD